MADPELDQILAEEIESRLPLLAPGSDTPPAELRAALHSLRGATAMAGHIELSVLLAQASQRIRRGEVQARASVTDLLSQAVMRLRDGKPPLPTRWPEPPPGLVSLPLEENVRAEYLASMRDRLLQFDEALESTEGEALDEAYRAVHGMKSAAAGVGDDVTAWFCHGLESLLHDTPREGGPAALEFRQQLVRHRAALALLLENPARGLEVLRGRSSGAPVAGALPSGATSTRHPSVSAPEDLRVPTAALDRVLERLRDIDVVQEELRSLAELGQRRTRSLRDLRAALLELPRVAAESSEGELLGRVEELARDLHAFALTSSRGLAALRRATTQLRADSGGLRRELTELRVTNAAWLFARACRGLVEQALAENKSLEIVTEGDELPVDRPLADRALGALSQLLRNAVAHGIEPEAARLEQGKPREGRITLKATRTAALLRIEVQDDGRGVDLEELRRTAAALGMDPRRAVHASPDHELLTLLVLPGLTTRGEPDLLAGRGMGLHLAQQTALALGGSLTLQSQPQQGFSATLDLPVEGALPQVLWLRAAESTFALPTQYVLGVSLAPAEADAHELATLLGVPGKTPSRAHVELAAPGLPSLWLGVEQVGETERVLVHPVPEVVSQAGPYAGAVRGPDGALHLALDARALLLRASSREGSLLSASGS
jgi:chemotaxis protein histidine kinase CheA